MNFVDGRDNDAHADVDADANAVVGAEYCEVCGRGDAESLLLKRRTGIQRSFLPAIIVLLAASS